MKMRISSLAMIGAWIATFVVYVLVRPDDSTGLPLKMIPLLTQTEEPAATTTESTPSTTVSPSTTTTQPTTASPTSGESGTTQ